MPDGRCFSGVRASEAARTAASLSPDVAGELRQPASDGMATSYQVTPTDAGINATKPSSRAVPPNSAADLTPEPTRLGEKSPLPRLSRYPGSFQGINDVWHTLCAQVGVRSLDCR